MPSRKAAAKLQPRHFACPHCGGTEAHYMAYGKRLCWGCFRFFFTDEAQSAGLKPRRKPHPESDGFVHSDVEFRFGGLVFRCKPPRPLWNEDGTPAPPQKPKILAPGFGF